MISWRWLLAVLSAMLISTNPASAQDFVPRFPTDRPACITVAARAGFPMEPWDRASIPEYAAAMNADTFGWTPVRVVEAFQEEIAAMIARSPNKDAFGRECLGNLSLLRSYLWSIQIVVSTAPACRSFSPPGLICFYNVSVHRTWCSEAGCSYLVGSDSRINVSGDGRPSDARRAIRNTVMQLETVLARGPAGR